MNEGLKKSITLTFYANKEEAELGQQKATTMGARHVRPFSVLVCPIGQMYAPGAWQKTVDMVLATNKAGVCCWLKEIEDSRGLLPFHTLCGRRDLASFAAADMGFDWVLWLDNDALPEPDTLLRLLKWDMPIVVPYIYDYDRKEAVAMPQHEKNTGLKIIDWSALACTLIWTRALRCFESCMPHQGVVSEGELFSKFLYYGHRAYQDTDTELELAKPPSYGGPGYKEGDLDKMWDYWRGVEKKRADFPDRSPINPLDPNQKSGIYMPREMG